MSAEPQIPVGQMTAIDWEDIRVKLGEGEGRGEVREGKVAGLTRLSSSSRRASRVFV